MLTFLLAVIVIVGAIWLAVVARWFRWVLAALAALVLAVVLYFVNDHYSRKREEEASKHRIPINQVQFEDMSLHGFQESSRITGRVRNTSQTCTLTGAGLEISVQDCAPPCPRAAKVYLDEQGERVPTSDCPVRVQGPDGKMYLFPNGTDKAAAIAYFKDPWEKYATDKCETVGQTTVTSWSMNIPPMQSRAYDESVFFSSLPAAKGTYRWNYRVVYVKGAEQR